MKARIPYRLFTSKIRFVSVSLANNYFGYSKSNLILKKYIYLIVLPLDCKRNSILIQDDHFLLLDFHEQLIYQIVRQGERFDIFIRTIIIFIYNFIIWIFFQVLRYLKIAFDRKLLFSIGVSATTGKEDVVIWNNSVDHKTQFSMYPDPTYLQRCLTQLVHLGVTD